MHEKRLGEPDSATDAQRKNDLETADYPDNRMDEQGRSTHQAVTLIQCTNSKRDTPAKARDLYDTSSYFRAMRDYADAKGDPLYILSAKHGLVAEKEVLEPYDEFGLSDQQATEIAETLVAKGATTATIVAGKKYTNPLTPELESKGIDVIEECRGLRIGKRVKKLKQMTRELVNESLC